MGGVGIASKSHGAGAGPPLSLPDAMALPFGAVSAAEGGDGGGRGGIQIPKSPLLLFPAEEEEGGDGGLLLLLPDTMVLPLGVVMTEGEEGLLLL